MKSNSSTTNITAEDGFRDKMHKEEIALFHQHKLENMTNRQNFYNRLWSLTWMINPIAYLIAMLLVLILCFAVYQFFFIINEQERWVYTVDIVKVVLGIIVGWITALWRQFGPTHRNIKNYPTAEPELGHDTKFGQFGP